MNSKCLKKSMLHQDTNCFKKKSDALNSKWINKLCFNVLLVSGLDETVEM